MDSNMNLKNIQDLKSLELSIIPGDKFTSDIFEDLYDSIKSFKLKKLSLKIMPAHYKVTWGLYYLKDKIQLEMPNCLYEFYPN